MAISLKDLKKGRSNKPPRVVVYGTHGIGKTTFANDAGAAFVAAEDGLSQIDLSVGAIPYDDSGRTVANSFEELTSGLMALLDQDHSIAAMALDTIDWTQKLAFEKVCRDSGVDQIELAHGGYGKGYVEAQNHIFRILHLLDRLRDERGMAIIVLAHSRIVEHKNPEGEPFDRYTLDLHASKSGSVNIPAKVMEWADAVLFARYKTHTTKNAKGAARGVGTGERVLMTEERPAYLAKNRYGLPHEIPFSWEAFISSIRQ